MSTWHVGERDLRAWIEGTAALTSAVSIEQHLERCTTCQDSVAALTRTRVATLDVEASWTAIRDEIEPQPLPWMGRQLRRLGVSEPSSWVTSSAPALTGAWVTAVTLVLGTVLAAALWAGEPGQALFLALAPVLPMLGVASSYGAEVDPMYELTIAAPFSKLRILLLRTTAVVAVCIPLSIVGGMAMEGPWWVAVAWLLPAAAFLLITLASATFVPPHYAATITGLTWVTLALSISRVGEPSDLFTATATVTYALVAGTAAVVFVGRLRHLATQGRMG